jgi:hypothetical protein
MKLQTGIPKDYSLKGLFVPFPEQHPIHAFPKLFSKKNRHLEARSDPSSLDFLKMALTNTEVSGQVFLQRIPAELLS